MHVASLPMPAQVVLADTEDGTFLFIQEGLLPPQVVDKLNALLTDAVVIRQPTKQPLAS